MIYSQESFCFFYSHYLRFFVFLGRCLFSRVLGYSSAVMAERSLAPAKTVREHLEQSDLHVKGPEPIIKCRTCHSVKCTVDHFVDKHNSQ
jgi:hypothetical protein